jgi:hypothetical protein
MPQEILVEELKNNIGITGDLVKESLSGARPGICALYKQVPGGFTGISPITRDAAYAMDKLCSDQPLPPPMVVPFTGGQSQNVDYRVTWSTTSNSGNTGPFTEILKGAIGGVTNRPSITPGRYSVGILHSIGVDGGSGIFSGKASPIFANPNGFVLNIISVTRVDGLPDTGGNPQPRDPYSPPLPDSGTPFNVPVPNVRGGPNLVIPVIILPPIIAPISITPTLQVNFKVPINVGGIRFELSGDKITKVENNAYQENFADITNNFATVNTAIANTNTAITNSTNTINNNTNTRINNSVTTINSATSSAITTSQTNITNAITNSTNSIVNTVNTNTSTAINLAVSNVNSNTNTGIANVIATINALATLIGLIRADVTLSLQFLRKIDAKPDCPEPLPPPANTPPPTTTTPDTGGDSPPKRKLLYIEVILDKLPHKMQFGNKGAQTVYFAGWISFRSEVGAYYERAQINFQRSIFPAPADADGYTYTLTHGAKGRIKEYYNVD